MVSSDFEAEGLPPTKIELYFMGMQDFRKLEHLVTSIQSQLAPNAAVEHDVRLRGIDSGVDRQVDVLVREQIGQYEISIAIECKDHSRPLDVKGVEEFIGLLNDIRVNQGVLVSASGFTAAAKARSEKAGILLYSPVDTAPHKWQKKVSMPALCDFRVAGIGFRVSCNAPLPFRLYPDFFSANQFQSIEGDLLGTAHETIANRWNLGEFEELVGVAENVPIFGQDALVQTDNGYGQQCPVDVTATISVKRSLFSGHVPVEKMSGFRDELSGKVITNAFTLGILDPDEVFETWKEIESESDLPELPPLIFRGLVLVDADARIEIDFLKGVRDA